MPPSSVSASIERKPFVGDTELLTERESELHSGFNERSEESRSFSLPHVDRALDNEVTEVLLR